MSHSGYRPADFDLNPLMFYYETTLACDLVCKHCRASAQESADPGQLTTEQSKALIDQVNTFPRKPMMVMTGGDPLKRPDLFELIRHATGQGLQVALTPSATPLATLGAFERARKRACDAWGSASTASTPPRTTPSAASRGVSRGRWRCSPTPGN